MPGRLSSPGCGRRGSITARPHSISRREFLTATAAAGGAWLLAACTGRAPSRSFGASANPSGAKYPLGQLEGATVVTDPTRFPTTFHEAPELAKLVASGALPPVEERIGQDPLVLEPAHEIGRYVEGASIRKSSGGRWDADALATGPATMAQFAFPDTSQINPYLARAYEANADASAYTLSLRRGMRWSDGEPFTADDLMFWHDDIYLNKDLGYSLDLRFNGNQWWMERVDDETVRYVGPESFYFFEELFLRAEEQSWLPWGQGGYAPGHYLKQFHPKYVGESAANKLARDEGLVDWVALFLDKSNWNMNADLPVVMPWKVIKEREFSTGHWALERNPYSIWVDTAGNQLPYIAEINFVSGGNEDSLALSVMAGDYHLADDLSSDTLPLLVENQDQGGYKVHFSPSNGVDYGLAVNLSYEEDPEIGGLLRTDDFRRALSMGIDRQQINLALFTGLGTPTSFVPAPWAPSNLYSPGEEWVTKWATLDVEQANALLDGLDLPMGSDGYRQRRDGSGRLTIEYSGNADSSAIDWIAGGEMIRQQWRAIGVDLNVLSLSTNLLDKRASANQLQLTATYVGSTDVFLYPEAVFPSSASGIWGTPFGPLYGRWFETEGEEGKEPYPWLKDIMDLYREGYEAPDEKRIEIGEELWRRVGDACLQIGIVGYTLSGGGIWTSSTSLGNVPDRIVGSFGYDACPQTFYFK